MAAEPALDRSSKCFALARSRGAGSSGGAALAAGCSGPSGVILIGLAGGVWAYQELKRPARDPDAIWQQAEADFVAGHLDRAGAALKRLGQLRKPSPLDQMLGAQLAAAHNVLDEALACLADVPDDHYMAPRGDFWPARSSCGATGFAGPRSGSTPRSSSIPGSYRLAAN